MTAHDPDLIRRMTRARDLIIRDDLRAEVRPDYPDLNAALEALAAKYDAGDEDRAAAWQTVAHRAHRADRTHLADRAYLAYLADFASLADLALVHMAPLLTPMPDLDAQIWARIQDSPDDAHEQKLWETACGTTYCRGGWAVHLQPHGAALVEVFGWALPAMAIYRQNTGAVPNFSNMNNAEVREEIRAAAEAA
jgi:hypothetical protein